MSDSDVISKMNEIKIKIQFPIKEKEKVPLSLQPKNNCTEYISQFSINSFLMQIDEQADLL